MKHFGVSLLALLIASPASAVGVSARVTENLSWFDQFKTAPVSSSFCGTVDDSGITDNDAALNACDWAAGPVVINCPNGGYIGVTGSWAPPNNTILYANPGCCIKTTNTSSQTYAIQTPASLTATSATTNVQLYGLQIECLTPSQGVRAYRIWIDGLKLMHSLVRGCGGGVVRGWDREIAFNSVDTRPLLKQGNPGWRDYGTLDNVTPHLSQGMAALAWYHNDFAFTGDSSLQSCQPASTSGTWQYAVSTDNGGLPVPALLYQNSWGHSQGTETLVNLQNIGSAFYTCNNVVYSQVSGEGTYFMDIVPGIMGSSTTNHIQVYDFVFNKIGAGEQGTFQIGNVSKGTNTYIGTEINDVVINHGSISNSFRQSFLEKGCFVGVVLSNMSFGAQNNGPLPSPPNVEIDGACGLQMHYVTVDGAGLGNALQDSVASSNNVYDHFTITNVRDGFSGAAFGQTSGASFTASSVAAAPGSVSAVGVSLTANPNGTVNSTVTGNSISAPTAVQCAPGQGNNVTGNSGASNCPP